MSELSQMVGSELARLSRFAIEHPGIGKIVWEQDSYGPIDVRGLDLDRIVSFEESPAGPVVTVYSENDYVVPTSPTSTPAHSQDVTVASSLNCPLLTPDRMARSQSNLRLAKS